MIVEYKTSEEIFKELELEENSIYLIVVKVTANNPAHKAVLFTGFRNGAYCKIYNNSYDNQIDMMSVYSFHVIKQLH